MVIFIQYKSHMAFKIKMKRSFVDKNFGCIYTLWLKIVSCMLMYSAEHTNL